MKDKKGISLFAKNLLNVLGTKIFIYIWTLGGSVFIARILGPEKKGELALVISIYSIGIQILNMGLHSSNTYYISQDKNNTKYALGNSLIITLFTLCLSGVGFFICRKIGIFHLNNILLFVSFIMIPVGIFVMMHGSRGVGSSFINWKWKLKFKLPRVECSSGKIVRHVR